MSKELKISEYEELKISEYVGRELSLLRKLAEITHRLIVSSDTRHRDGKPVYDRVWKELKSSERELKTFYNTYTY